MRRLGFRWRNRTIPERSAGTRPFLPRLLTGLALALLTGLGMPPGALRAASAQPAAPAPPPGEAEDPTGETPPVTSAGGQDAPESSEPPPPVAIGSKPFGESYLLGEIVAQLLESRGHRVDRRLGLGATEIAFQALRTGGIDLYPEYTGTGLLAILDREPEGGAREVFRTVQGEFRERWGVRWLPPLGIENTFAVAVRRETAERLHLRTLSDLAALEDTLVAGFSPDFIGRADGLPGLRASYDLELREVRSLMQAVKYEALAEGRVDLIDGYSTDGFVERYDFVILEDDRGFFPPYEAALVVGPRLWRDRPEVIRTLSELSGLLDDATMRRLNRRVEVDGEPLERVAREGLETLGLLAGADGESLRGSGDRGSVGVDGATGLGVVTSLPRYLWERRGDLWTMTLRHLLLVGFSLSTAVLLAVPLGLVLERTRAMAESVIRGVGLLQTVPSIALLAFMIPLLGIGVAPALVALFLYSLFPILRNTFTGIRDADPAAVGANWTDTIQYDESTPSGDVDVVWIVTYTVVGEDDFRGIPVTRVESEGQYQVATGGEMQGMYVEQELSGSESGYFLWDESGRRVVMMESNREMEGAVYADVAPGPMQMTGTGVIRMVLRTP